MKRVSYRINALVLRNYIIFTVYLSQMTLFGLVLFMQRPSYVFFLSILQKILVYIVHHSQALWLHRRFLSLCLIRHLTTTTHGISCHSNSMDNEINIFLDKELRLLDFCSTIQDMEFEDFEAQATYSTMYFLWLIKVIQISLKSWFKLSYYYH